MERGEKILSSAQKTLGIEANALTQISNSLGDSYIAAIEEILNSKGRLIVTGIGKSANIANKIVATFNSTGTPAIFMHAADAIHGDLGLIQKDDLVLCLSKSGNTPEIKVLIPLIKSGGNTIIGMCSNEDSHLGRECDHLLYLPIEEEACPNNLAPTTSTTAQLAVGDAMAVSLIECRGFSSKDFAKYHPGGSLGKRLYLKVSDLLNENSKPQVTEDQNIPSVILEMTSKRLGSTAVLKSNSLVGMITDGDLRRMLQSNREMSDLKAKDIMTNNPLTIGPDSLATEALSLMESKNITQLIVLDREKYLGIIHLHDLLKEGIY